MVVGTAKLPPVQFITELIPNVPVPPSVWLARFKVATVNTSATLTFVLALMVRVPAPDINVPASKEEFAPLPASDKVLVLKLTVPVLVNEAPVPVLKTVPESMSRVPALEKATPIVVLPAPAVFLTSPPAELTNELVVAAV
jgi:hypothetical protein